MFTGTVASSRELWEHGPMRVWWSLGRPLEQGSWRTSQGRCAGDGRPPSIQVPPSEHPGPPSPVHQLTSSIQLTNLLSPVRGKLGRPAWVCTVISKGCIALNSPLRSVGGAAGSRASPTTVWSAPWPEPMVLMVLGQGNGAWSPSQQARA